MFSFFSRKTDENLQSLIDLCARLARDGLAVQPRDISEFIKAKFGPTTYEEIGRKAENLLQNEISYRDLRRALRATGKYAVRS